MQQIRTADKFELENGKKPKKRKCLGKTVQLHLAKERWSLWALRYSTSSSKIQYRVNGWNELSQVMSQV